MSAPGGAGRGGALLLKWIVCAVPAERRDAFDVAQRRWSALGGVDGFAGQVGGWDARRGDRAGVLGLWRDRAAYDRFMREVHDGITGPSGQAATYSAIAVALAEVTIEVGGAAGSGIASAIAAAVAGAGAGPAGLLRVAECRVGAGREASFEQAQRAVWNPAMAAAGALGGAFARRADEAGGAGYVVATLWPDVATHARYAEEEVPRLREAAGVARDLAAIEGWAVPLLPAWAVAPTAARADRKKGRTGAGGP